MGKVKDKVKVICAYCGKIEYVRPSRAQKYCCCSVECLGKYNSMRYSKRVTLQCPICGKTYECKQSKIRHHRTCGDSKCQSAWRSQNNTGSNNPNYKKVEDILKQQSAEAKHEKSKTIYQHVVKEAFGLNAVAQIPKGYVIHHKDANHSNNDVHNLVLLPKSAHRLIHTIFGNVLIGALHTKRIDRNIFRQICNDEQWNFYKEIIDLDVTKQKIVKSNEINDNSSCQSVYTNIIVE